MPLARRMMRRRAIVGGAIAVSAVSSARRNRAERQAIEGAQGQEEVAAAPQDDMTTQLTQLKGLLDQGVLTQEEFDAKKKQLLGL